MKNVKFFLTVTTFCLGIAAVAATKANSRINETGYTQSGSVCTVSSGIDCNGTGTSCKNGSNAQLYRFNSGGACSVALAKP